MRDSDPKITEAVFAKYKKDAQICASLPLLTNLAGDEPLNWHPLLSDFILLGQKLEELGFAYGKDEVIILGLEGLVCSYLRAIDP